MREQTLKYLRAALGDPDGNFRKDQWESIEAILAHKRVLVVQRTGWGKSMVYFLATKLLRDQGAGPTLLVSPLLSLMRNQIEAAQRLGVRAETINSSNKDQWDDIYARLNANKVDLLLISPERLANDKFRNDVLASMVDNIGLLVVDEAHCISDWGHDFRPDYRRIVRVLQLMPSNVPVLATTATANDRVVADVQSQLGADIDLIRGSLVRKSLRLQNINMPSPSARMAWLAEIIPQIKGSGIVYALTQRDVERVKEWLQVNAISAESYHAGMPDKEGVSQREELEQKLLNNEIKVLVATVALGMGFDKPDLGFVIHFQRPSSVVHYYQQVGRAGRAVNNAYGVLLCGEEDDNISNYFIRTAFPSQNHISAILRVLDESDDWLSLYDFERKLNLRKSQVEHLLKFLTVESPSPINNIKKKWHANATTSTYSINQAHVDKITAIRHAEQKQMRDYMNYDGCLMAFLQDALDDPNPDNCGKCRNCAPSLSLSEEYNHDLANRAGLFLRRSYQPLQSRKQWPAKDMFEITPLGGYKIPITLQASEGRALCLWRDAGWGELVAKGKYTDGRFADELVTACADMLKEWNPDPAPGWIACIPSTSHPALVMDFAERLATILNIPFVDCVAKIKENRQQKEMENSFQQARNLDGVFGVTIESGDYSPCLLVDDMVDSRWTFTVASALLRQVGCSAVYPLALAMNSPRMD